MSESSRYRVLVGTCGFGEAQSRAFRDYDILEVQQSFYQPPRVETAERWRCRAPRGFVFTLKAWQLLTHEASSPTYRRLKTHLSEAERAQAGGFRWNALTRMAWERTRALAGALEAEAVVFQTPRRFQPTHESVRRLTRFFERIERDGRRMVFEPRGDRWSDDVVRALVQDLDIVHGVDPFLRRPVGRGLRYFRLHGRPAYHYRYRYSDAELALLQGALSRAWPNWVLFNNDEMNADARRFRQRLAGR
ncbi:MAG: DUF72 domain-containing protein [Gammaproteobacteria bacterium]|nr:DUF72 domain-containing protein [Gammaproteobacteria bacterium]NIR84046.1 DUF72 domain-containing protein [Gammaproteobacteria bacterium]NIR89190.1 DUF72 domain-containing protein [Gammaproteobacteria bacterium]NIU04992.1 DUF72 domain-containing protein [Gammaproteobacteria bacterium]NIV52158.1 DUF72 domain-containing protein [Gammaproteobacteria bacterium]